MNPFTDLLDLEDKESYVALLMQAGLKSSRGRGCFFIPYR